jgi:DNA-binding winged helix-turn-helix (wHTH) protein
LNNPGPLEKNKIYTELLFALRDKIGKKFDYSYGLNESLQFLEENGFSITFFIEGLDKQMTLNDYGVVKELYEIHQKIKKTSFIFFLQYPISEHLLSSTLQKLNIHTNLIRYQGTFSIADSLQFILYLQRKWKVQIDTSTKEFLIKTFDINYGLIKSAVRIIRLHEDISKESIIKNDFIKERAEIILRSLPSELVVMIQNKKDITPIVMQRYETVIEYLVQTKMIQKQKKSLRFTCAYYDTLTVISHSKEDNGIHFTERFLSQKEALIFEELKRNKGVIVTRERIGDVMWGEEVGELYSEWAIDQAIHRIRGKLQEAHLSYNLITRKGLGFILLES